jgi:hypothetical protein
MIGKAVQITLLVVILVVVGYVGLSIRANCTVFRQAAVGTSSGVPEPEISEARYRVELVNVGRMLFADDHTQDGLVHAFSGY